jgi:hypothetical protein
LNNTKKEEKMKKTSILISLVILLLASPACSVGGAAAATVPVQKAGGIDGPPGPETIDLTSPELYIISSAPAYKFDTTTKFTGVDKTGAAKEVSLHILFETQTLPQRTQHGVVEVKGGEGSAESIVIGDQVYVVFLGKCNSTILKGQNLLDDMPDLQQEIKGQAKRVESGIDVNGYVTDKYKLTGENIVADDELISSFVYVARKGGFITLFELEGRTKTGYQGLDPKQFTNISLEYNNIPVEDGSLDIAVPAECAK